MPWAEVTASANRVWKRHRRQNLRLKAISGQRSLEA
jgi:hypothetical protein